MTLAAVAASSLALFACKARDEARVAGFAQDAGGLGAFVPGRVAASALPPPVHDELDTPLGTVALDAASRAPVIVVRAELVDAGSPAVDPDAAILDAARAEAARCFVGLPRGGPARRTATVTVTVISTGTVSHADVRSLDTPEPYVVDCLKRLGEGLRLTERSDRAPDGGSAALRTYAIEVAVAAAPH